MTLAPLSVSFQSLPPLPTVKVGPSGAASQVGGFVYVLGPCGSLQWTLLWGWEFLPLCPQPPQVFSIRGLRLYFPTGTLGCLDVVQSTSCCLASQLHPGLPSSTVTTSLGPPAAESFSPRLPVSTAPTCLDECCFFISLFVRLPYSSIFSQFWLFFVFKLLLSFFWLCKEAQCVYLRLHLGQKSWEQVLFAASLVQIFSLPFSLLPSYKIPHSNTKLLKVAVALLLQRLGGGRHGQQRVNHPGGLGSECRFYVQIFF